MSQDPNQYPQNDNSQDQGYEPTIPAFSPNPSNPTPDSGKPGNPPSSPYPNYQTPPPAPAGGQSYPNLPGYPTTGTGPTNPYENSSPYMPNTPQPQPGSFPQQGPYNVAGGGAPYPGYMPIPQPKKSKTWLWITLSIVGGLLVIAIVSCAFLFSSISSLLKTANAQSTQTVASVATADNSNSDPNANSTPSSNSGGTNISPAVVGKTNTLQNVNCTVTSVKQVPGDEYTQPKSGDEFIVIHVKITNNNPESQDYNPLDFSITDSSGNAFTHTYDAPSAYENQLSFGTLKQGDSVEGDLVFEVSSSDHTPTFSWDPVTNDFADNPGVAQRKLNI